MELIRNSIFETNSSSTHSLIIESKKEFIPKTIPRNSKEIFMVDEYGVANGGDEDLVVHKIIDEVDKLRFTCNVLATICDDGSDRYDKLFEGYDWQTYYNSDDKISYIKPFWDRMINCDLFTSLKEAVFEVTGTQIDFIQPDTSIPFYDCVYIENDSLDKLFHINDPFDKEDFKSFIKDLIFNENIIITDESIPYGCGDFDI